MPEHISKFQQPRKFGTESPNIPIRETYVITIRDAANRHETRPMSIRLRTLLKLMLRGFALRCTDNREVKSATPVAHVGNERKETEPN